MFGFLKQSISILLLGLLAACEAAFNESCTTFMFLSNDTTMVTSTFFAAGAHVDLSSLYQSINTTSLPAFCRVELKITTNVTANSTALAEVWLPENWNNRFLAVGNSGFSGGGNDGPIFLRKVRVIDAYLSVAIADMAFLAVNQGCECLMQHYHPL